MSHESAPTALVTGAGSGIGEACIRRLSGMGWRVFAGDESDAYANEPENTVIMPLRELIGRDRELKEIFRTPAPCAFERESAEAPFRRAVDR